MTGKAELRMTITVTRAVVKRPVGGPLFQDSVKHISSVGYKVTSSAEW